MLPEPKVQQIGSLTLIAWTPEHYSQLRDEYSAMLNRLAGMDPNQRGYKTLQRKVLIMKRSYERLLKHAYGLPTGSTAQ